MSAPVAGLPDARLKSVRFRLRSIVLEGARTLDPALFAPLWEGLIGRQISLLDLKKVVEGIERIYRENDYYGAAAVPQQDFASGRIRIILYDSYIRDVVVKSERPGLEQRLGPYIARMEAMRPVRISRLERYLLLIADIPGMNVEANFSKIEDDPGAGRLVLNIDQKRYGVMGRLDNLGARTTGPQQLSGIARLNDAFGLFEGNELLAVTTLTISTNSSLSGSGNCFRLDRRASAPVTGSAKSGRIRKTKTTSMPKRRSAGLT